MIKDGFNFYVFMGNFLLKVKAERLLRPVAMMLGYVKNRQPMLFHSHPGQG